MADFIDRNVVLSKFIEGDGDDEFTTGYNFAVDEYRKKIAEIPTVDHWISCSDRLPNEAGEYLVCGRWRGEKPKTWICQFIISGNIWGFANPAKNPPISFWMPFPEPPEKENE